MARAVAGSSNGRTPDSGSGSQGSSPCPAALRSRRKRRLLCCQLGQRLGGRIAICAYLCPFARAQGMSAGRRTTVGMPHTTRQGPQHDAGVLWVVWLLGWIQRTLNELAYDWLQWIASRRTFVNWLWVACEVKRKPKPPFVVRSARWLARLVRLAPRHSRTDLPTLWMNFNYAYALVWLVVILGGYIALACWHPLWFRDLVVALAAWRVAEILTWQLKMLLDRTHRLILAAERNLVFLFIDGFVTVTAIAVLLRQAPKIKPTTTPFTTWVDS